MKKKPVLSVIIPCFNAQNYIKSCLDSIFKSNFDNFEVIVVDDGSTDGSPDIVRRFISCGLGVTGLKKRGRKKKTNPQLVTRNPITIKLIENDKNLGAAAARNIGVKKSSGKYLVFLDADTQVEKEALKTLLAAFKKYPKVGAIQAKLLLGKTGKIDTIGHFLSPFGFPYEVGHNEPGKKYLKKHPIFAGRTAALTVRKNIFEKIGGFDEDYLIYGEDTDLCWRIWLAGYQVIILPQAKVYHYSKSSLNQKTYRRIFFEGAKNHTRNIIKNAPMKVLIWMLPLHILAWGFLSLKLIFQGQFDSIFWIWKGILWNLKNARKTLKKRKKIASYTAKNNQCSKIMFGKTSFMILVQKGWRWFRRV